jgi:hypothetical protein
MATYAPQNVTDAGLAATYNPAAGGGDKVPPGCLLHVKNTGAVSTLQIATPATFGSDGTLTVADRSITIPATTGERFVRLDPPDLYRGGDGLVSLTWTSTAGVTFAVLS